MMAAWVGSRAPRFVLTVQLALADLAHGWRSTLYLTGGVAVALAPVLLLYGLNFGFVSGLIEQLREDPRTRELRPIGQFELDQAWFDATASNERVSFLLPRTRYLASNARLRSPQTGLFDVELVPSASGDPLLAPRFFAAPVDGAGPPTGVETAIITASVAAQTNLGLGDLLELRVSRSVGERLDAERLKLRVVGVLDRGAYQRDAVFISSLLLDALEGWREGHDAPALGWSGVPRGERLSYASFRMFARDVRDVPALRDALVAQNIDVRTRAESISTALAIEEGLGWLFGIVTLLTTSGFALTLALHLSASVVEKARDLSVLRLLGARAFEISLMPMAQGTVVAGVGALIAGVAVIAAQDMINERLDGLAEFSGDVSLLLWSHVMVAVGASALIGAASGGFAGVQAARLEPSEGLRRE